MRIRDWSSDVCSSDLACKCAVGKGVHQARGLTRRRRETRVACCFLPLRLASDAEKKLDMRTPAAATERSQWGMGSGSEARARIGQIDRGWGHEWGSSAVRQTREGVPNGSQPTDR